MATMSHRKDQDCSLVLLRAGTWGRTASAILSLLLLASWAFGEEGKPPWRVLMLFDEASGLRALEIIERSFERTLLEAATRRVEFYHEHLDASRFRDSGHHELFADYLRAKYGRVKLDVVVPIIGARLEWASRIPRELFQDVPIVYGACPSSEAKAVPPVPDMTGVLVRIDVAEALRVALAVRPQTRRVVVVSGPATMYPELLGQTEAVAKGYPGVTFEYWTERTAAQILEAAAALPGDSLVFYLELFRDSAGASFCPWQFGQSLAKAANAPVFGIYDSYLDTGIVGGAVTDFGFLGAEVGRRALRVLNGESASAIPVMDTPNAVPMFDWRAMERWGIRDSNLPPGSIVRFRPPSVWEAHRELVLAGAAVVVLQMAMIAGLLLQRARRRRVEEALRQSESRLALAADSAQAGLWSLDLAAGRFWMTDKTREMFGFAPDEEVSFERFLRVVHPEDRERVRETVERSAQVSETVRVEYRVVLRDGSVRWMVSRGRTPLTASGAQDCVVGVSVDITESKAAEEAILYEKLFAETLVNGLPGIFYLYDSEWRLVRWNRNHEVLTGFSADEMRGKPLLDWFEPEHKDIVAAAVRQVFEEGEATVEAPLSMKDGSQVPYLFKGIRLDR